MSFNILETVGNVVDKVMPAVSEFIEDKDKSKELEYKLKMELSKQVDKELQVKRDILVAEIQGKSWLQRSWRPVTMLTFVALIVAHWLGFTPENISEKEVTALLDIVKIGLGGYVIGRSAEKVAETWRGK